MLRIILQLIGVLLFLIGRVEEFANKVVASKATLYLKWEPVLLDRFIVEMVALAAGTSDEAELEGI
jgi:hypothetical protein